MKNFAILALVALSAALVGYAVPTAACACEGGACAPAHPLLHPVRALACRHRCHEEACSACAPAAACSACAPAACTPNACGPTAHIPAPPPCAPAAPCAPPAAGAAASHPDHALVQQVSA